MAACARGSRGVDRRRFSRAGSRRQPPLPPVSGPFLCSRPREGKEEREEKDRAAAAKKEPPSIQGRIEAYRAQKAAAAAAHIAAPKFTTALLLGEVQVTGIFRTPRGWSAMVEATPLSPKLSYVIYPGDNFFDGQLVAIEEGRLVFRRDTLWTDGKREKLVEIKPLRAPNPIDFTTAVKTSPAESAAAEAKADAAKSEAAKPETSKPAPEKP